MSCCAFDPVDRQFSYVIAVILILRVTECQTVIVRGRNRFFRTDQIPEDFGTGPGVMKAGLADITLESRKELKDTISKLAKIILKKEDMNAEEIYENPEDFKKTASTSS